MTHTPELHRVRDQRALADEKTCNLNKAAPDMLKMLLELQECAEYWSEYDVPLGIVDRLNETIRKARGEDA